MSTTKTRKSIWLSQEVWDLIDKYRDDEAHESISNFIEASVKLKACSIDSEKHDEVLSKELITLLRANIKNAENHIASTLFKLAGEQATLNLLIADQLIGNIDEDTIREYRNDAYEIVRKRHGVFNFEDAIENSESLSTEEGNE